MQAARQRLTPARCGTAPRRSPACSLVGLAELLANGRRLRAACGGARAEEASALCRPPGRGKGPERQVPLRVLLCAWGRGTDGPCELQEAGSPTQSQDLYELHGPSAGGGKRRGRVSRDVPARRGGGAAILKSLQGSSSSAPSVPLRAVLPQGALTGQRVLGLAGSGNALGAVTGPSVAPLSSPPAISSLASRQRGESSGSPAVRPDGVWEKVLPPTWGSLRAPPSLCP